MRERAQILTVMVILVVGCLAFFTVLAQVRVPYSSYTVSDVDDKMNIRNGSVETAMLFNQLITNDKLATRSVDSRVLADRAVNQKNLADGAVTQLKLANGAVSRYQLDPALVDELNDLKAHIIFLEFAVTALNSQHGFLNENVPGYNSLKKLF